MKTFLHAVVFKFKTGFNNAPPSGGYVKMSARNGKQMEKNN